MNRTESDASKVTSRSAADMRAGKTTPRAYLDETLARIENLDPGIGAFVVLNKDGARKAADASTARWKAGKPLSPVDGMPVAIKDIIETADMPTGQGSPIFEGTQGRRDSATVHALREAGAVIIGKTTTTEFAASHPWHTTKNPHDATRTPGGSSSGSAASVGAGMVPAGLGSQVVGSILRPSSFCGVVGYKPSVGGLNRSGSHDHFSQSCAGVLAASLADNWAVTKAIATRAGGDPGFVGVTGEVDFGKREKPKRLAFLETGGWKATSEGARKAFEAAKEKLAKAGIEIKSRREDPDLDAAEKLIDDAQPLTLAINAWEGRWPLNTYHDLDAKRLSPNAQERYQAALAMSQSEYRGPDQAPRRRSRRLCESDVEVRRRRDARCLRRRPGRPQEHRQHRNERRRLASLRSGADRAAARRREHAAWLATPGPRRTRTRRCSTWPTGWHRMRSHARTWWARRPERAARR